jgi:hypothetical protein
MAVLCAADACTRPVLSLLQYIIGMDPKNVRDILKASNDWMDKDGSLPALDEVSHPSRRSFSVSAEEAHSPNSLEAVCT